MEMIDGYEITEELSRSKGLIHIQLLAHDGEVWTVAVVPEGADEYL